MQKNQKTMMGISAKNQPKSDEIAKLDSTST
jgi:hypothetical protein